MAAAAIATAVTFSALATPALPVYATAAGGEITPGGEPGGETTPETTPAGQAAQAMTQTTTATGTISVRNVEAGATVTAYQLATGNYRVSNGAFTGYSLTDLGSGITVDSSEVTISELVDYAPATETTAASGTDNTARLAKYTQAAASKVRTAAAGTYTAIPMSESMSGGTRIYSASVQPGLYLVTVSVNADATYLYNPVLLAVNISDANDVAGSVTGSDVDVATAFENGTATAYMKRIAPTDTPDPHKATADGHKGDASAIGEPISFVIDNLIIPSYSDDQQNPTFTISDTLESNAFATITNLTVKVGGETVQAGNDTYTLTGDNGQTTFTIAFTESYIRAHGGWQVVITYDTALTAGAGLNYAENVNHAAVTYSNDPTSSTTATVSTNTYHYTFGINAAIDGESTTGGPGGTEGDPGGYEINKVSQAGGSYSDVETTDGKTRKNTYALAGAEFTLYTDAACQTKAKALIDGAMADAVSTSDENGHLSFIGLDEGTYYLAETKAPQGYIKSQLVYKVSIMANYNETSGILERYEVRFYNNDTGKEIGSAVYTNPQYTVDTDTGNVTYDTTASGSSSTVNPAEITNATPGPLPFTGGEGRQAIYIGSAILAAAVVILLIVRQVLRRRTEN